MNEGVKDAGNIAGTGRRASSFHTAASSMAEEGSMEEGGVGPRRSSSYVGGMMKKGASFHSTSSTMKRGGSFHITHSTRAKGGSFHSTPSTAFSKSREASPVEPQKAEMAVPKVPQLPMPVSKGKSNSNRPIERRRPKQRPPLESTLETEAHLQNYEEPQDELNQDTKNTMQVLDLLWRDLRGVEGKYSGQINSWIQPHGFGSLVLVDGTTITCKWFNGTPLDRRRSDSGCHRKESLRRSSTSRRSSEGNEERHHRAVLDESSRTARNSSDEFDYKKSVSEPAIPSSTKAKQLSRRHTYQLGDAPLSSKHMVVPSSMRHAIENANSLKTHDFAFVLRSNGDWCYAIVAKKNAPSESRDQGGEVVTNYEDANIIFVTDTRGSTKCIKMKHWGKMVRLVNL